MQDQQTEQTPASNETDNTSVTLQNAMDTTMQEAMRASSEPPLSIRSMLEAGVHFGHQTNRWNPKMKSFIFGARNGIHIIDLQQTVRLFQKAYQFILNLVAKGESVLFVGTKKQCQELVQQEAARAGMFYVNNRWLGGTLTNFKTVKASIERLRDIEKMAADGTFEQMNKKEVLMWQREQEKLEKALGGIKTMTRLPGALFVIDAKKEHLAIIEARKLRIPVIAIADTNADPDLIDYLVPGNDDALRSVQVILGKVADACIAGTRLQKTKAASYTEETQGEQKQAYSANQGPGPRVETARRRGNSRSAAATATPTSVTVSKEVEERSSTRRGANEDEDES